MKITFRPTKEMVLILTIAVLPVLIFGFIAVYRSVEVARTAAEKEDRIIIDNLANQTQFYLTRAQDVIKSLAGLSLENIDQNTLRAVYENNNFQNMPMFESLAVVGSDGKLIAVYPPKKELLGLDYSRRPFFEFVIKERRIFFSRVKFSSVTEQPVIKIATPVFKKESSGITLVGIVKGSIRLQGFSSLFKEFGPEEVIGQAILVSQFGEIIAHPDYQLVREQENINNIDPELIKRIREIPKERDIFQYSTQGIEYLVSFQTIAPTNWRLIVQQKMKGVLAVPSKLRQFLLIALVITFLGAGGISYQIASYITQLKREREKARKEREKTREERLKELEEIKSTLEIRVGAKTRQLREQAEALKKENEEKTKALMNILEDVEAARAEAEEERDKTLAIIENFPEGLMFFDQKQKLSSVNPKTYLLFNLKPEELLNKNIKDLSTISSLVPLFKILGKKLKGVEREELKLKENLFLEVSTITVMREKIKIGALVILRDVTREKLIERLKTEFVSIAAHQLRTPLSAIKWSLKTVLDKEVGETPRAQKELLEKTYQSNERMIDLIDALLNVTRIEEGRFLYDIKRQDVIKIVQKTILPLKEIAKRKRLRFKFQKPKIKIPEIRVDAKKTSLVVQNLIDNAIRYTNPGGNIKVSIKYLKDKKEILISVQDTGIGIPKSDQHRVFSRFFRAANAIKTETEGSGLGVYIAKNIVEAHGGKIWFESEENKGTTFYFTLPIQ